MNTAKTLVKKMSKNKQKVIEIYNLTTNTIDLYGFEIISFQLHFIKNSQSQIHHTFNNCELFNIIAIYINEHHKFTNF
jgi:hypothetical protein